MGTKKKPNPAKEKIKPRLVYMAIDEPLIDFAKHRAAELQFPNLRKYINDLIRRDKLAVEQRATTA